MLLDSITTSGDYTARQNLADVSIYVCNPTAYTAYVTISWISGDGRLTGVLYSEYPILANNSEKLLSSLNIERKDIIRVASTVAGVKFTLMQ